MEALHDVVQAGKARYLGASSMYAWQFAKTQHAAERHGWTPFVSMQNHYNLIYREEEREMLPLCLDQGVGVIPWSPLARGRLTRPVGHPDRRSETDGFGRRSTATRTRRSWRRCWPSRERRGVAPAQVALAWLLAQPGGHLADRRHHPSASTSTTLSRRSTSSSRDDEIADLGADYVPHAIAGHQ